MIISNTEMAEHGVRELTKAEIEDVSGASPPVTGNYFAWAMDAVDAVFGAATNTSFYKALHNY